MLEFSELKYSLEQELLISLSEAFIVDPPPPFFKTKQSKKLSCLNHSNLRMVTCSQEGALPCDWESDCHYLFCDLGQINYILVCHVLGAEDSRDSLQRLVYR